MQGITVALSKSGIEYFLQQLVDVGSLGQALKGLRPVDRTASVPDFFGTSRNKPGDLAMYSNINVQLSNGSASNFTPKYQSLGQQLNGVFQLMLSSGAFNANYAWQESFTQQNQKYIDSGDPNYPGEWRNDGGAFPVSIPFSYSIGIGSLATTVTFTFTFDKPRNAWTLPITSISPVVGAIAANIPGNSVLQNQVTPGCVASHVNATTADSVSHIDYQAAIQNTLGVCLSTIPASGHLTPEIVFDFGVGDSGLVFPNGFDNNPNGMQIGVKGVSTYKDPATGNTEAYPGKPPTGLGLPAVPDGHHLQMYVSDYVFNGLYWAFFRDGKLAVTVTPNDLPNSDLLNVSFWVLSISALKPYSELDMQIQLQPMSAPTVKFQEIYPFTQWGMDKLKQQIPSIAPLISGISGRTYLDKTSLEQDLAKVYAVDSQYFAQIEQIVQFPVAVAYHDIQFIVTILGAAPIDGKAPFIEFAVSRTDFLEGLALGITHNAQTLKFSFFPNEASVSFTQSNFLSKTVIGDFGNEIWPNVCEQLYDNALSYLGATGVPLPIMQGFQFLFEPTDISVQPQGFIAILTNVEFRG